MLHTGADSLKGIPEQKNSSKNILASPTLMATENEEEGFDKGKKNQLLKGERSCESDFIFIGEGGDLFFSMI